MATMIKEKRREKKKKTKEKITSIVPIQSDECLVLATSSNDCVNSIDIKEQVMNNDLGELLSEATEVFEVSFTEKKDVTPLEESANSKMDVTKHINDGSICENMSQVNTVSESILECDMNYTELNQKLERINISYDTTSSANLSSIDFESSLEVTNSSHETVAAPSHRGEEVCESTEQDVIPSAPMFDETPLYQDIHSLQEEVREENVPKVEIMPFDEAVKLFGSAEIDEVREISAKEAAIVDRGPICEPDHPLIDLLSNFRCSLRALEQSRSTLVEERARESLSWRSSWRVESRRATTSGSCACGAPLTGTVHYEHAELDERTLETAARCRAVLHRRLRTDYCHHQHAALLAHALIEERVSEYVSREKSDELRTALALVLAALQEGGGVGGGGGGGGGGVGGGDGDQLAACAMLRWAEALTRPLLASGDLSNLLYIIHHMRRQRHSVLWAARMSGAPRGRRGDTARSLALLALLLTSGAAVSEAAPHDAECEETWEEVDRCGSAGAVSAHAMRERDLLCLFDALSEDFVERLVFGEDGCEDARVDAWGAGTGERAVKAWCGARVAGRVLCGGGSGGGAPPHYGELARRTRTLALHALAAVTDMHMHHRSEYRADLIPMIEGLIDTTLTEVWAALRTGPAEEPVVGVFPWRAASDACALRHCREIIHRYNERGCSGGAGGGARCGDGAVEAVAQIAVDRPHHDEVARQVLHFLFKVGLSDGAACAWCARGARAQVPRLARAHAALHHAALRMLADCAAGATVVTLRHVVAVCRGTARTWLVREGTGLGPGEGEGQGEGMGQDEWTRAEALLEELLRRDSPLLEHLLLSVDTTPHTGLPLETQRSLGAWLARRGPARPWAWPALRRLRLHRLCWAPLHHHHHHHLPLPEPLTCEWAGEGAGTGAGSGGEARMLLRDAYNLLATSWGHQVPLICSEGAEALERLSRSNPSVAVHCLDSALLVLTQAPDSIALTPRLVSAVNHLLLEGPSLLQRALGRRRDSGADLLTGLMVEHLTHTWKKVQVSRSAVLSTWAAALWAGGAEGAAVLERGGLAAPRPLFADVLRHQAAQEGAGPDVRAGIVLEATESVRHSTHVRVGVWTRLLHALHAQRGAGRAPHVDDALKSVDATCSSSSLSVYRLARATTTAPADSSSTASLWTSFIHLYLQRPTGLPEETTPPVGPMFFSGFIKSRELSAMKARLRLLIDHHRAQVSTLRAGLPPPPGSATPPAPAPAPDEELPRLTLADLAPSAGDSPEVISENETDREVGTVDTSDEDGLLRDRITYHTAVENMMKTYLGWLEEGDKVTATIYSIPEIPEHAMEAARRWELSRVLPPPSPSPSPSHTTHREEEELPAAPPSCPPSPYERLQRRLRKHRRRVSSRVPPVNLSPPAAPPVSRRALLAVLDTHLQHLIQFVKCSSEAWCRLERLDTSVRTLTRALRPRRPAPSPGPAPCPRGCRPRRLPPPSDVHHRPIDDAVQADLQHTLERASHVIREVTSPRRDLAAAAAVLYAIGRSVTEVETARLVLERCWGAAREGEVEGCAPALDAITTLYTELAERVVSRSGAATVRVVSSWRDTVTSLQSALGAALVRPRRLPPSDRVALYRALLRAPLPEHTAFTYISKFEMSRWSTTMSPEERAGLLQAATDLLVDPAPSRHTDRHVLIELVGTQWRSLVDANTMHVTVVRCARAAAVAVLPHTHWTHVLHAIHEHAHKMTLDELGHTLREMGAAWMERRTHVDHVSGHVGHEGHVAHAGHVAHVLHALLVTFVHVANDMRYDVQKVAWYGWSGLQEAWCAWVLPGPPPLLPPQEHAFMLQQFARNIMWLINECKGAENFLLQEVYLWAGGGGGGGGTETEGGAQLLHALETLPWTTHQWFSVRIMQPLLNCCLYADGPRAVWSSLVLEGTNATTWSPPSLSSEDVPLHLANLLYVFTALPLQHQCMKEACQLEWRRLPTTLLEPALERFFTTRYDTAVPYHQLPCFRVVLAASALTGGGPREVVEEKEVERERMEEEERSKRLSAVSMWTRALTAPPLASHLAAAARCLLETVTDTDSPVAGDEPALSEVLSRAVTMLCTEPAASLALPVWLEYVCRARVCSATLTSLGALPSLGVAVTSHGGAVTSHGGAVTSHGRAPLVTLAECAARAHLHTHESGWEGALSRWDAAGGGDVRQALGAVTQDALHLAYLLSVVPRGTSSGTPRGTPSGTSSAAPGAAPSGDTDLAELFHTVAGTTLQFADHEPIMAVWVCFACRMCSEGVAGVGGGAGGGGGGGGEAGERRAAAASLLRAWSEERKRGLLQTLTLTSAGGPTPILRLLCRLALYIVSPGPETAARYETAAALLPGATLALPGAALPGAALPGAALPGAALPGATRRALPRLARSLLPKYHRYFQLEYDLTPSDD